MRAALRAAVAAAFLFFLGNAAEARVGWGDWLTATTYHTDNFVRAGQRYTVPDERMPFDFRVTPPFGGEMIKAVASLRPFQDGIAPPRVGEPSPFAELSGDAVQAMSRGIAVVPSKDLSEDSCAYSSVPR